VKTLPSPAELQRETKFDPDLLNLMLVSMRRGFERKRLIEVDYGDGASILRTRLQGRTKEALQRMLIDGKNDYLMAVDEEWQQLPEARSCRGMPIHLTRPENATENLQAAWVLDHINETQRELDGNMAISGRIHRASLENKGCLELVGMTWSVGSLSKRIEYGEVNTLYDLGAIATVSATAQPELLVPTIAIEGVTI
jgi:hypothetical protein